MPMREFTEVALWSAETCRRFIISAERTPARAAPPPI